LLDMAEELFRDDAAFPRLSDELIAILDAVGRRRRLAVGDLLFRAGEPATDLFVLLSGRVAIVTAFGTPGEETMGVHGERRVAGELGLMTGQPAYNTAVVREAGEAIVLSRAELVGVIADSQEIGDVLLGAFMARRLLAVRALFGHRRGGSAFS
jgi:thioredoxin reductase (NADPH)